jgi:SAM-dependent methyltransferase
MHGSDSPSPWVTRWAHLVPANGVVLDVACGLGRHLRYFYKNNHAVVGIDTAQAAIEKIASECPQAELHIADIENQAWPLLDAQGKPRQFAAVVVTNYLWRPLFPTLLASVQPGGVLIYETFAVGNETIGKPSRPDFLLRPGELLAACAGLRVVAYEDGFIAEPERFVQRIVAVREIPAVTPSMTHAMTPSTAPAVAPTTAAATTPSATLVHQKSTNSTSISPPRYRL